MKRSNMTAILLILVLAFSLTACGGAKNNKENASGQTSESGTSLSAEPGDDKEAADLYQKLMQKEEDIQSANAKLWEKLFLTIDKDQVVIGDNNNYGDFLLKAIEAAKDQFTADELKILNDGAGQIREIEEKLMALEEKYPDCVKMPGEGESAAAGNAGSGQEKFPDFQGKDLDGKEVNSSELFSGNTVTVVNFWFTTCKPCVGELADLDALNQELAQKGGAVVGINAFTLDGDEGAIAEAKEILSKKGAAYQNLWFDSDSDAGRFTAGLYAFPTTYVVDQDGNIVGQPIVGAVTSPEQTKALNALIEQALATCKRNPSPV